MTVRRIAVKFGLIPIALAIPSALFAQVTDDAIAKIRDEGMNRSQVMQTLSYLTDVIGPRLTGSPQLKHANEWTKDKMNEWGMKNGHLEAWGPFGRGWTLQKFSAQVTSPVPFPLIAYPKAWSPGVKGTIHADVVYVDASDEAGLEKYKGKLKGAIVLTSALREPAAHFTSQGNRYTDEDLAKMAAAVPGAQRQRGAGGQGGRPQMTDAQLAQLRFQDRRLQFVQEEGAAVLVDAARGDGGTLFVQSATVPTPPPVPGTTPAPAPAGRGGGGVARRVSPWDKDAPKILPQVSVAIEHYNRMMRMLQLGQKVTMSLELDVQFQDADMMAYNTVAEIPGTDKGDEIVMMGGHMDSWHSGSGATDNAAGVCVAMEAARILQAIGLKPRRTIRVALWSGEEQGMFGSRAYVAEHFGAVSRPTPPAAGVAPEPGKLTTKPDYEKFSGYFNLDNGTGKIRGVYCQGNESVRSIFQDWLKPFADLGATTTTLSNTGSTDHVSFDGIGLPGFQFIQDPIEYDTRTHHSNQDVYDRIQAADMKQAAVIMATFVYQAAMRDEKLPRKPAPAR